MRSVSIRIRDTDTVLPPSPPRVPWILLGLLLGLAAYASSFGGAFVFDDLQFLEHPHLQDPWGMAESTSRPLHFLLLALNYRWWGEHPAGYHAVNLAVHLAAAFALFRIAGWILAREASPAPLRTRAQPAAFLIAAIWMVHPLQTESVTYIYQRTESLMGMFLLWTVYASLRSFAAESARNRWLWRSAAIVLCLLGTLSKEAMAIAPILVLCLDRAFASGSWRNAWRAHAGLYLGLAGTWLVSGALILTGRGFLFATGRVGFDGCPFSLREQLLTQPGVILEYLRLCVWPDVLCLDRAWPATTLVPAVAPGLVLLALLLLTLRGFWRNAAWSVPLVWFFVTLAPTSSFLPMPDQMVEHRMYLPLAGVAGLAVAGCFLAWDPVRTRLRLGPWIGVAFACLVIALLATRTAQRNLDYHTPLALWEKNLALAPQSLRVRSNYAKALAEAGRPEQALPYFLQVYQADPTIPRIALNLGRCLLDLKRAAEAVPFLQEQIERDNNPGAHQNLAVAFEQLGRLDLAHWHYAVSLELQGNARAAAEHYAEARRLRPAGKERAPRP